VEKTGDREETTRGRSEAIINIRKYGGKPEGGLGGTDLAEEKRGRDRATGFERNKTGTHVRYEKCICF
jgi:hypothetical protein